VWHTLDDEGLFTTIKKGVPGADMPASNLPDDQIWQLAAFVRSMNSPAIEQNVPGNLSAGEGIFWGKGGCSNCHQIRGKGGLTGPDLTNVGGVRPVEQIREDIASPSADGYETWRRVVAVTRDGKTIEGALRNRSNYSLQIQDVKGVPRLIAMAGLREVTIEKKSPMPADFASRLSKEEMRDLVAYLSRQSIRPAEEKK
jgi:putative heme-binding domain-containing protein